MKRRSVTGVLVAVLLLVILVWPDLLRKNNIQRQDRTVTLAVDWNDLYEYSQKDGVRPSSFLNRLKKIPVNVISVEFSTPRSVVRMLQNRGFVLLWRTEQNRTVRRLQITHKFKRGEGLLSYGEVALGYPFFMEEVVSFIQKNNGFYPLFEFGPQKGRAYLTQRLAGHLIKGHYLKSKERLLEKENLWLARLNRAVEKRWVRLLFVEFSPARDLAGNVEFLDKVVIQLNSSGYRFGPPQRFGHWKSSLAFPGKMMVVFLLAFLTPLFLIYVIKNTKWKSAFIVFILMSLFSLLVGLVIHGFGSHPDAVLGIETVRGIKVLLVVPLIIIGGMLISSQERKKLINKPATWGHLVGSFIVLALFFSLYLMRSGNFPLIAVSESERLFRDWLESVFWARPRMKEFIIGHPLLLLGLFIQSRWKGRKQFFEDGRLWIWLGMVGQISIINTFLHFHSPVLAGVIRSLHGLWLGFIFSIPLCYFWIHTRSRTK